VVIADTPYDVQSAAQSNIRLIGVRSGGFSDRALGGAVAVYNDVKAMLGADIMRTL
jgi:phosphoglycolate phosphatase-like HAD superfamily hydrolase